MSAGWEIVFYATGSGRLPVKEFIDSLDELAQDKIYRSIVILRERNTSAGFPLARPIDGKLWELRIEVKTNIYRVFYFFYTGRTIVLLHAFQKKTQKTPDRDIQLALRRMKEHSSL